MKHSAEYLNSRTKRRLDVLGGTMIAAALLPAAAFTAIISEVDTNSLNPLFRQVRIGKQDQPLEIFKFRTIPKATENKKLQIFGTFDPRASKVGSFLRETGLDELPQFFNVLRGDMSLVGMRPLLQEDVDRLQDLSPALFKDWYEAYSRSKPGLTGPSQMLRHQYTVSSDEIWLKAMDLDLQYARQ